MPWSEVLLVFCDPHALTEARIQHPHGVRLILSDAGRARQLNAGAQISSGELLWFLHADSRLSANAVTSVLKAVASDQGDLHYLNLYFFDGPLGMSLNTAGVWIRSHVIRIPFGDQGLLTSRRTFERLGGFPENAPFGEDHLFVWRARQLGVRLRCTEGWLGTSARKYAKNGWAATTLMTLRHTVKQAVPEFINMYREKP